MRAFIGFVALSLIAVGLALALYHIPFGQDRMDVARDYLARSVRDTGAPNVVTGIVVNYRALDTLGEVTVLFSASLGVGMLMTWRSPGGGRPLPGASLIVRRGAGFLFPFILLFGGYIFVHGHLTPGGGFQGGAVIASAFLLLYLGIPGYLLARRPLAAIESLTGITFVAIGIIGLAVGGYFLNNFLPKGSVFSLFSAGVIPILYMVIGLKVGAELAGVVANMIGGGEE